MLPDHFPKILIVRIVSTTNSKSQRTKSIKHFLQLCFTYQNMIQDKKIKQRSDDDFNIQEK